MRAANPALVSLALLVLGVDAAPIGAHDPASRSANSIQPDLLSNTNAHPSKKFGLQVASDDAQVSPTPLLPAEARALSSTRHTFSSMRPGLNESTFAFLPRRQHTPP